MKQIKQYSQALAFAACLSIAYTFCSTALFAQNAAINYTGVKPHPSALLDISDSAGTHKGLLIPRMTLSNRNAISNPATGLIIYQTDNTPGFYYNSSVIPASPSWVNLSSGGGSSQWITASSPTTAISYTVGNVGIGTNTPSYKLSLSGTSSIADRTMSINTTPVIYLPDQSGSALEGSIAFGTGLRNSTSGSGQYNTAVGIDALLTNTSGYSNTALGYESLKSNTSGYFNTVVGFQSLYHNTTGIYNTAMGSNALVDNTTGSFNTAIGENALISNTEGYQNVAVGFAALNNNTTGFYNTAIGNGALIYNTEAYNNTAVGSDALYYNTVGSGNVALGGSALQYNIDGNNNLACGSEAMFYNTQGSSNCAVGTSALLSNTTGSYNSALGYQSLMSNKSGVSNVAHGYEALESDTGSYNTAIGTRALYQNVSGNYNTSFGYRSGYDVTTGSNNTFLGPFPTTGVGITTGSNNILIGYDVRYGLSQTGSNQLNIGNLIYATGLGSGNTLSSGNLGIGTATPGAKLDIAGNIKIADGTQGVNKVLTSDANGLATWQTVTSGGVSSVTASAPLSSSGGATPNISITSPIPVANGGTGLSSYTIGDVPYASGTTTLSKLAGVATGNSLISGGVGAAPLWGKIGLTSHVTGVLPLVNGGTNTTTTAVNGGIVWSTASSYSITPSGTAGQYLKSNGAGQPIWGQPGITTIVKDVVNSTTSFTDVTGLSFAVVAGVTYRFHAAINYSAAATTTGSRWSVSGPTATMLYTSEYSLTATTSTINTSLSSYNLPASANATSQTTNNTAVIDGTITPSVSGTVIVRFASEVGSSAITAKGGSRITWW